MNDRLLAVIGGILLVVAVGQAAPGNGLNGRIVGGQDAGKAQFPHQVSLRERGSHICGGSIISRNWVLTAAHCVSYIDSNNNLIIPPSDYTIRAGSNDRFSGGIVVKVVQVEVHQEYGNFLNDVAVLCVESPFIYSASIQPIALPTKNTPDNAEIIISGWGRLRQGGDIPRYLQWNTLKSLSMQECENAIKYGYPNILCLQHEADNGACNGDSGGPAVYNNEVVGIAGFVYDACGTSNPDGYARVYEFVDWIKAHTDVD